MKRCFFNCTLGECITQESTLPGFGRSTDCWAALVHLEWREKLLDAYFISLVTRPSSSNNCHQLRPHYSNPTTINNHHLLEDGTRKSYNLCIAKHKHNDFHEFHAWHPMSMAFSDGAE